MKGILWGIFELSVNLFQSIMVVQTLRSFLGERKNEKCVKYLRIIFVGLLFLELSFVNSIVPFEGLGIIISILILYIYALIALRGSAVQKLFWSVFILLLIIGLTTVVLNIEGVIIGRTYLSLASNKDIYRFVGVTVIQIILFYITRLVIKKKQKDSNHTLKWNEWFVLLVIPVVSIFTMTFVILVAINAEHEMTRIQQLFSVMSVLGILITNFLVYVLYAKLQKDHEDQMNYKILQQAFIGREKNIEETKVLYQSIRKTRHDLKQHVGVTLMMLQQERYSDAIKYLEEYSNVVLNSASIKIFCNNDVINYLLNSKCEICDKKGIETYMMVTNELPPISDLDLCVLLGNALDNAIEGCCSKRKKELYLELRRTENFFMIIVKNTICNSVLICNPQLTSTKRERGQHGLGILSMQEIVKKYNGSLKFSEENGRFCCDILLDIPETSAI